MPSKKESKKKVKKLKITKDYRYANQVASTSNDLQSITSSHDYLQQENLRLRQDIKRLEENSQRKRYEFINDLIKSIATINDAAAHLIGETGGGLR